VARAFWVLVGHSFQRHWRVRQMGWVALGLLGIAVVAVGLNTMRPAGWGLEGQRAPRTRTTYRDASEQLLPQNRYRYYSPDDPAYKGQQRPPSAVEVPAPFDPTKDALQSLLLSIPHVVMGDEKFLRDWAMMNFSSWVVLGLYLGFILPLFTLSYASGAFGAERESRTLVWLMTRPLPRSAIYLAKFLGTLPWCLAFAGGGFVALCAAGGGYGREALRLYWPAALAGTIAFAALFHLIGALFRRPVVVGLVYIFFFEALVGALPGSLKLLSLTFYARCLMYNGAVSAGYPADLLEVSEPVSPGTAWAVLVAVPVALTLLGMWLFARAEYRDDV
jgi:ABC-type transport system involved in multi-copper enzyme maturation permease subunit